MGNSDRFFYREGSGPVQENQQEVPRITPIEALEAYSAEHPETVEDITGWYWKKFERLYEAHLKRKAVEAAGRMKDAMVSGLWGNCVMKDIKILTKRGFLTSEEVQVGDETIGYNPETQMGEWTKITDIHEYKNQPTVNIGSKWWNIETTPNHKWLVRQNHTRLINMRTMGETNTESYLLHSVPFSGSQGLPISDEEAAIIGWVIGEGHFNYWGTKGMFTIAINQAKEPQVDIIEKLVKDFPFVKYIRNDRPNNKTLHIWRFSSEFSMDLWERAGLVERRGVLNFILNLNKTQLENFMDAIWWGEGSLQRKGSKCIYQNEGEVSDALELGVYLLGFKPSKTKCNIKKQPKLNRIQFGRPTKRTFHMWMKETNELRDVWCPTTELGTWTAKDERSIFLTGNSNFDDDKNTRKKALIEIENSYQEAIINVYNKEKQKEIEFKDDPFFSAMKLPVIPDPQPE